MLVGGSNSAAASLRLAFVGQTTIECFLINILLIGFVNSTPWGFGPGKAVLWQSQHLWWSWQAISGYLRISQSGEAGQGLQIHMLSYKQAQTGNYLPTGIILGKQTTQRHRPGERSVKREFIYCCGPGYEQHQRKALSWPSWESWPCRIRATTPGPCARSLYAKPKSLPQHPQLEDYSLCHVCSAASALCPHIEPLISAPCLFSPSPPVWFLFFHQFVVSFLPLFVFWRTRLLLLRNREQEGPRSRCGCMRKSPICRMLSCTVAVLKVLNFRES